MLRLLGHLATAVEAATCTVSRIFRDFFNRKAKRSLAKPEAPYPSEDSMKQRGEFREVKLQREPDFTTLTSIAAITRIRQLASLGLPDSTIAEMFAWSRSDVRRAIAPDMGEIRR
jgi:hypothetical protein